MADTCGQCATNGHAWPDVLDRPALLALAGIEGPAEQGDANKHQKANPAQAEFGNASGKVEISGNLV